MKLVYKNIIINTLISLIILFLGEGALYVFLKNRINSETTEHLYNEALQIKNQVEKGKDVFLFKENIGDNIQIQEVTKIVHTQPLIQDAVIEESWEEEYFETKKIVFDIQQNQKYFRVSVFKTLDENEGIGGSMAMIIFFSALSMLLILVLVNVFVYYRLFTPVYKLIKDIEQFSVEKLQKIDVPQTNTLELKILGSKVSDMSSKMIEDYNSIKEFMENITHEIQTPLAVINSKVERCMQDQNLSQEQAVLLSDASKAVNKLFNLNKGLTLLSKINNRQYDASSKIHLIELIQQRILYFSDFIENRAIQLKEKYQNDLVLSMNKDLSEILIDNLIKNAIQHNINGGDIILEVTDQTFLIANSGKPLNENSENFFKRFYTQSDSKSMGLGLAIVQKIIDYYGFQISYLYEHNMHVIRVNFNHKG